MLCPGTAGSLQIGSEPLHPIPLPAQTKYEFQFSHLQTTCLCEPQFPRLPNGDSEAVMNSCKKSAQSSGCLLSQHWSNKSRYRRLQGTGTLWQFYTIVSQVSGSFHLPGIPGPAPPSRGYKTPIRTLGEFLTVLLQTGGQKDPSVRGRPEADAHEAPEAESPRGGTVGFGELVTAAARLTHKQPGQKRF